MAITAAQLQAALGTNPNNPQVLRHDKIWNGSSYAEGTIQRWYVSGGVVYPGRCRWVETTASDDAATQAAAVIVGLKA